MATNTLKPTYYVVAALFRKKKNGSYRYEWIDMRSFGNKKDAVDYAKRESKLQYYDGRTGRYLITKSINDSMYEDGKKIK